MTDHPTDGELADEHSFIEFAPHHKTVNPKPANQGVSGTFWYAEGWIGGERWEFATGTDRHAAEVLCDRLNRSILAALRTPEQPANTDHTDAALADATHYAETIRQLAFQEGDYSKQRIFETILRALRRTPAPVNAEQPEAERCPEPMCNDAEKCMCPGACLRDPEAVRAFESRLASKPAAEQPAEPEPTEAMVKAAWEAFRDSRAPLANNRMRDALRAALASSRSSETELLRRAVELRDDLLSRAEWDGDAKVVVAGAGAWVRFNDAIDATLTNGDG